MSEKKKPGDFGITQRAIDPARDLPTLYRIYAHTRLEEMEAAGWPIEEVHFFLTQQFLLQHQAYTRGGYSNPSFHMLEIAGQPIGRLYVDRGVHEIRIVDIALLPEARSKGFGEVLLRDLLEEATASQRTLSIHVEKTNRARSLYERLGFVKIEDAGVYDLMEVRTAIGGA